MNISAEEADQLRLELLRIQVQADVLDAAVKALTEFFNTLSSTFADSPLTNPEALVVKLTMLKQDLAVIETAIKDPEVGALLWLGIA